MRLSIVATLYRSEAFLREFHARSSRAAEKLTSDHEIILVNDGSPDRSLELALEIHRADARVKLIDLSRNFGHHKAMMTGLAHASGDQVFLIDSDLEEPPELLEPFAAELLRTGADVVYGVQTRRKGALLERITGALFFKLFNLLSSDPIPANLCTVRLMTRRYVSSLIAHQERQTVIGGLWAITGYRQVALPVQKGSRPGSSYGLVSKLSVLVNSVTSFSDRPLLFIFYLGLVIMLLSTLGGSYLIVRRVFFGVLLPGWPSLIVSVWFLGGLTVFCLGILGIYLSKVFIETKQRPYTIVRAVFDRDAGPE